VAGAFDVEAGGRCVGIREDEGGRLVNRDPPRTEVGVWMLPPVESEGVRVVRLGLGQPDTLEQYSSGRHGYSVRFARGNRPAMAG
jgi:hypothetical protein